jgi:hypothetical protein
MKSKMLLENWTVSLNGTIKTLSEKPSAGYQGLFQSGLNIPRPLDAIYWDYVPQHVRG